MQPFLVLILIVVFSGCSSAGPFVTNISSDGRGSLVIEKQKIEFNGLTWTVSNESVSTATIKVVSEEK